MKKLRFLLLSVSVVFSLIFNVGSSRAAPHGKESEGGGLYWRAEGQKVKLLFPERVATFQGLPFIRVGILWHSEKPIRWYAQFPTDEKDGTWRKIPQIWQETPIYIAHIDTPNGKYLSKVKLKFEGELPPSFVYIELIPELGPANTTDSSPTKERDSIDKKKRDDRREGPIGQTTISLSAPYLPRSAWGAKPPKCKTSDPRKYRIAIHHTAGSNTTTLPPEKILRSIQAFHQNSRKWCDIAYHILISKDGRAWEGRPYNVLGSHVRGQNRGTLGISFMGNFQSVTPNQKMLCAGSKLIDWAAKKFNIPRNRNYIKGHREYPGQSTSCPGNRLLGKINWMIQQSSNGNCGSSPPPPTKCDYVKTARLGGAPLNIRQRPTAKSADIGDIPEGVCLKVLAKTDSGQNIRGNSTWYKVNYKGTTGWISGYYADCSNCGGTIPKDGNVEGIVKSAASSTPIAGARVSVKNGPTKITGSDGKFSFTLKGGSYDLEVSASGYKPAKQVVIVKPGKTTKTEFILSPETIQPEDRTPPSVNITYPPDQFITYSGILEVRGTAKDDRGIASFEVNGQNVSLDSSGNFRVQIKLQKGMNQIRAVAIDHAGNKGSDEVTVFLKAREILSENAASDGLNNEAVIEPTSKEKGEEPAIQSDGGINREYSQTGEGGTLSADEGPQIFTISSKDQVYPCKTTQECYPPLVCIRGKCVEYKQKKPSGCGCSGQEDGLLSSLIMMLILLVGLAFRKRLV